MFGGHYYNLDAALAAGKISQAEYAAEILEGLINRANSLRLLLDQVRGGGDVDVEDYVKSYLEDVDEARARAMRAGLCKEYGYHTVWCDRSNALDDNLHEVEAVGGLLVGKEGK